MKTKEFFVDLARGATLGVSAAIPGVSAGTIAVVEGIYDKIVGSVANLKKDWKGNLLYLLPIILGGIIGAIVAFIAIHYGYNYMPFSLAGLFAGLIIGSLPVVLVELKKGTTSKERARNIILVTISFAVAALIGVLTIIAYEKWNFDLSASFISREWWIYPLALFGGFLAAGACVVPGISGSMCLFVIGLYQPILGMFMGDYSIFKYGDGAYKGTGVALIFLLIIGALLGLFLTSKAMTKLLGPKYRVPTFYVVFGLILGSLVTMFLNQQIWVHYYPHVDAGGNAISTIAVWDYILGGVLLVLGALFTYFLYKKTQAPKKEETTSTEEKK